MQKNSHFYFRSEITKITKIGIFARNFKNKCKKIGKKSCFFAKFLGVQIRAEKVKTLISLFLLRLEVNP